MTDDKKFENIMKLKREFEKDLIKQGKKIEPKKEKTKPTIYKPDIDQISINVPVQNIKTWVDFVLYDIELEDEKLSLIFENRLSSKSPMQYYNQFGLMHMLRNDYDKAENFFLTGNDIESRFNLGMLKIFRKDKDILNYTKSFLDNHRKSPYPYLLLCTLSLVQEKYSMAAKFLKIANDYLNYSFISMATALYDKDIQKASSYISKAFLEGKAKKTINILNFYIGQYSNDIEKSISALASLRKDNFPCVSCIKDFNNNKANSKIPDYCSFSKTIYSYVDQNKIIPYSVNTIAAEIIKSFNMKDEEKTNKLIQKLINSYDGINVLFFKTKTNELKKGLKTNGFYHEENTYRVGLTDGKNYYKEIVQVIENLYERYHTYFDFMIDIPFYESLKIVLGWKTCKRIY
ncbi:hypothetical protein OF820_02840 [Oceanotoga sp. DSM 15011]|jgi:hypothetical protein|uniref:Tetratricopeptide repeat protein n=1 Tax=Oceanotoga teriensis TaxID=515440 RepID=A0AA45C7D1_9BACT|nr:MULTISPECIES: hypothetical protein [Oceanotoga]MDO7976724.1 hypothetical protein [Oceanotoga teriensis]PWJ95245.1 hypothetical protein C7380_10652 [Oceanotoga teriensis]UYP00629.1 hypothetical protein OF820_02840 [Oceanotoga sp. DSM 15011]